MASNTDAQLRKGNPAAKRMINPVYKARRKRSWERGQVRKELRRKVQAEAEKRNAALRESGKPTPWQQAKIARYMKRHNTSSRRLPSDVTVEGFRPAPIGWHQFGTHVDQNVRLEFSTEVGEDGLPLWERPIGN